MTWLMIKHHMQDHLVVGRIPVMSMGLPSRTLKMDFNGTVEKIITNREPDSLEIGTLALVPPAWRKNLDFFSHQRFLKHLNQNPVRPRFAGFHVRKWVIQIDSFKKLGFAGSHTEVDNLRVADYFPGLSLERHAELDGPGKAWRFSGFETCSLFSVELGSPLFF